MIDKNHMQGAELNAPYTTDMHIGTTDKMSPARHKILEVENLNVCLPVGLDSSTEAVVNANLVAHSSERIGIVGESGSGKSITLRAIAGLLPLSKRVRQSGAIRLYGTHGEEGTGLARSPSRSQSTGTVFQDPLTFLNPTMKIGKQVSEAIKSTARDRRTRTLDAMSDAGLKDPVRVYHQYPFELSGGMRQRALIAMVLASKPELILADEPTTALDATTAVIVTDSLLNAVSRLGSALIFVSHDLPLVASICDRIYVMKDGVTVENGKTRELLSKPKSEYTISLLDAAMGLG